MYCFNLEAYPNELITFGNYLQQAEYSCNQEKPITNEFWAAPCEEQPNNGSGDCCQCHETSKDVATSTDFSDKQSWCDIVQPNTVFVTGLSPCANKKDIEVHFSVVGPIMRLQATKQARIFVYKNKKTNISKGEATITYENKESAKSAIIWLNGSTFYGQPIKVSQACLRRSISGCWRFECLYGRGRRRNVVVGPQLKVAEKWRPPPDSWLCGKCFNRNFFWRTFCNRCRGLKDEVELRRKPYKWRPRTGDWICSFCANTNFAKRLECHRCTALKEHACALQLDFQNEHQRNSFVLKC